MPKHTSQFKPEDLIPLKEHSESMVKKASVENQLLLSENKDRFTKVALDLFRDNESDYIWKVIQDPSGEEFIVRTAQKYEPTIKQGSWSAETDKRQECVTLAYKGTPVYGFKRANLEINKEDMYEFRQHLVNKANESSEFRKEIETLLPTERLDYLKERYPEIF